MRGEETSTVDNVIAILYMTGAQSLRVGPRLLHLAFVKGLTIVLNPWKIRQRDLGCFIGLRTGSIILDLDRNLSMSARDILTWFLRYAEKILRPALLPKGQVYDRR